VLHEPPENSHQWDDLDHKLVSNVLEFGWHVALIGGDDGLPPWAFTVGLDHTCSRPDLVMTCLGLEGMHHWLNAIAARINNGEQFCDGDLIEGVLTGYTLMVKEVAPGWSNALFGWGQWFTQEPEVPMLQIVWPDLHHRFPWDDRATPNCRQQPRLWEPAATNPSSPWSQWQRHRS
jgi:hypothetical protein